MSTLRRAVIAPPSTAYGLALVCCILFTCSLMGACTRQQRNDTLRASISTVNAARDGFMQWDRVRQQVIVESAHTRDEAEQNLTSYRHDREPIIHGFEVAYRALALAATQTDDPSLKAALVTAAELVDAVSVMIHGGGST